MSYEVVICFLGYPAKPNRFIPIDLGNDFPLRRMFQSG